jgi:hypothetical protein
VVFVLFSIDRRSGAVLQFPEEPRKSEGSTGKLCHLAMSVPDPGKTAEFYKHAFGMEVVGETDSNLAEGVFLADGAINLALLQFKSDEAAQGMGRIMSGSTISASGSMIPRTRGGAVKRPASG